jgi:hypothetical protein
MVSLVYLHAYPRKMDDSQIEHRRDLQGVFRFRPSRDFSRMTSCAFARGDPSSDQPLRREWTGKHMAAVHNRRSAIALSFFHRQIPSLQTRLDWLHQ